MSDDIQELKGAANHEIHRLTGECGRLQREVDRLRTLVRESYVEGFSRGRWANHNFEKAAEGWDVSHCKKKLEADKPCEE